MRNGFTTVEEVEATPLEGLLHFHGAGPKFAAAVTAAVSAILGEPASPAGEATEPHAAATDKPTSGLIAELKVARDALDRAIAFLRREHHDLHSRPVPAAGSLVRDDGLPDHHWTGDFDDQV